jgi:HD-GYP domain-containing protein (c-di-GMP phosphodiesterase class II)
MLIEVGAEQLSVGMYVHSLDLAWYEHPFWSRRFLIRDQSDLEALLNAGPKVIVIDDSKGVGFSAASDDEKSVKPVGAEASLTQDTTFASGPLEISPPQVTGRKLNTPQMPSAFFIPEPEIRRTPLLGDARATEMRRATKMLERSKTEVINLFEDARLGKAITTDKISSLVSQISKSVNKDPSIILNVARLKTKDEYTYLHSVSVCALMINLGRRLGLDEVVVQDLGMAGMLHDLGKMSIPDFILNKPGKLDDDEWKVVRSHPEKGHAILSQADCGTPTALDVCLHHHEKMDGTGYPFRIPGENISLAARMAAICDVYDAITSQRSYNKPLSGAMALAKMMSWNGHFDQKLLRAFVESLGIFPIGSIVHLTNETLAVVIGEDPEDYSMPLVRIFYDLPSRSAVENRDIQIIRDSGTIQFHATYYDPDPAIEALAKEALHQGEFA